MGVKQLWSVIERAREEMSLSSLEGQTLAVDLGFWVCQMQTAVSSQVVKPHLRTLFFRISALMQKNINVVFIADGQPPSLKSEAMQIRQAVRKGKHIKANECKAKVANRSRFLRDLNECCELIELLGLPCLKAEGEAEALCAALNRDGLVNGVITDDSDAFLYGSSKVLRGFNLNSSDPKIDVYSLENIHKVTGLERNDLVVLSILLGCDYIPKGVPGVGKETANGFIQYLKANKFDPLKRLEEMCLGLASENNMCTFSKEECIVIKRVKLMEYTIDFEPISCEYLQERMVPISLLHRGMQWKAPAFIKLVKYLSAKIDWKDDYCIAKLVPVLTLWTLYNGKENCLIKPIQIMKSRIKQGVNCYEMHWEKLENDQITEEDHYITIEKAQVVKDAFPHLVAQFEAIIPKKKVKKTTKAQKADICKENNTATATENNIPLEYTRLRDEPKDVNKCVDNKEKLTVDDLCMELEKHATLSGSNHNPITISDSPLPLWERIKARTHANRL